MSADYMAGMGAMSGMDPVGQESRAPSDEGGPPVPAFRPPPQQQPQPKQQQPHRPATQGLSQPDRLPCDHHNLMPVPRQLIACGSLGTTIVACGA